MRLEISVEAENAPRGLWGLLSRVGDAAVWAEGLPGRYQAGVLLTDDASIAAINLAQRGIDRATDVLSFPAAGYPAGTTARDNPKRLRRELDAETGCVHLGDIVISLPRAWEQAGAFGHSPRRELGFLFAHGLLHLMGYDHMTETERAAMRAMEDKIMDKTGISRELSDADLELVSCAREAMERAYVPYSKYRVGACVRATDGRIFKGCNVENASYGLTICAERNALTTAVTEGMKAVDTIAIVSEGAHTSPCGACRQFLREFARDARVLLASDNGIEITTLSALLPDSFGPEYLGEVNA